MRGGDKPPFRKRLHFKIASFVIVTILVIFGSYSVFQVFHYQRRIAERERESSALLGKALTSSLELAMLNSDLPGIQKSFELVTADREILRVFLLNTASEVRASSDETLLGERMSKTREGCAGCHRSPGDLRRAITTTFREEKILRVVIPIRNKEACFGCHDRSRRFNGLLVLDRSLDPITAELYSSLARGGILAATSILAMMFLFRWYIRRRIINRIAYLASLAQRISRQDLDLDIELAGDDELTSLAHSLNNMKSALHLSMKKIQGHQEYLANLLENLVDGILIVDDEDRIVFANGAARHLLDIDGPPLRPGDPLSRIASPGGKRETLIDLLAASRKTEDVSRKVFSLPVPDRGERHLVVHAHRLLLPPRRRPETVLVVRDITPEISFEKQIHKSERLATIGRLAAGVAHEINNPMGTILMCSEGLIRRNTGPDLSTREYLEIIRNSARRCKMITQKLLDYSAGSNLRKTAVRPGEILAEAVSLVRFEASEKDVAITTRGESDSHEVRACRDSLLQVFVNLLLNGIQAVVEKGSVSARIRREKNTLSVYFEDDGPGIPSEDLGRVFEPFFTTKPVGTGTGLGLSVSQGIMKQHGGEIVIVESRSGHTSIRVSLPVSDPEESG